MLAFLQAFSVFFNFSNRFTKPQTIQNINIKFFANDIKLISLGDEYVVQSPYTVLSQAGYPELPVISKTLQIPSGAVIDLHVDSEAESEQFENIKLVNYYPEGASTTDQNDYLRFSSYPQEYIKVEDYWLRNQHLAQISFYPVQYDAVQKTLTVRKSIKVTVSITQSDTESKIISGNWFDGVEVMAENDIHTKINGGVTGFPKDAISTVYLDAMSTAGEERLKIVANQDGLYKITYQALTNAGFDTNIDPRTLSMSSQDLDVAIKIVGEEDGVFNESDFILFYGEKFTGNMFAERYANEGQNWVRYSTGWQPQITADFFEKYTTENVYWLYVDSVPGLRIEEESGQPSHEWEIDEGYFSTLHIEQQNLRSSLIFTGEDTWFWEDRYANNTNYADLPFTVPAQTISSIDSNVCIRGEIAPRNQTADIINEHHVALILNAADPIPGVLPDIYRDGITRFEFSGCVPRVSLHDGQNALRYWAKDDDGTSFVSRLYFNWFDVTYYRNYLVINNQIQFNDDAGDKGYLLNGFLPGENVWIWDTSDPRNPIAINEANVSSGEAHFERSTIEGRSYFAASESGLLLPEISLYTPPDLLSPTNGADYIIITHSTFLQGANELADYRASTGLRTKVVNIEDIYNEFGDGIKHPIAIKNFLRYAFLNWQGAPPSYVVLVGDDNFNTVGSSRYQVSPGWMPPYLGWIDWTQGEVDDTNGLACIVGEDALPDLAIARIPVSSGSEFESIVQRIIDYESIPYNTPWRTSALAISDNVPDSAGDFVGISNQLISDFFEPAGFTSSTVYLDDFNDDGSLARAAILEQLNTQGAAVVNYVGHGYVNRWASGTEGLFYTDSIQSLTNNNHLPIVLSMTCLDGSWYLPSLQYPTSIGEEMIRSVTASGQPRGGIAMWASTGFGTVLDHDALERGFLDALLNDKTRIGPATLAGKVNLFLTGGGKDVMQSFTLFGDPALKVVENQQSDPSVPDEVSASDGSFTDKVRVTWNVATSATSYEIYRGLLADGSDKELIGESVSPMFYDFTTLPNTLYYYRVVAVNPTGRSDYSQGDSGYRSNLALPPTNVRASDGLFLLKIKVSWNASNGAERYLIYRRVFNTPDAYVMVGETTDTYYDDFSIDDINAFEYAVTSVNGFGESDLSTSDTGYRATNASLPSPPDHVQASDWDYADMVTIEWDTVENASSYEIYRNVLGVTDIILIGNSLSNYYEDFGAEPNVIYEYRIKSVNSIGSSIDYSAPDEGSVLPPPAVPSGLSASDGSSWSSIFLRWDSVENASSYHIYRQGPGEELTQIGSAISNNYDDRTINSGLIYSYCVKSNNLAGTSDCSTTDTGYAVIPIFLPLINR